MNDVTEFARQRTVSTISVQQVIAAEWIWHERTLAEWSADLANLNLLIDAQAGVNADLTGKRAELDGALEDLRQQTVAYLATARIRFRNDPIKMGVLRLLSAKANSRADVGEQALMWELAWTAMDAAWQPRPGVTLAGFRAQRLALGPTNEAFRTALISERIASGTLDAATETLTDHAEAWYADATTLFGSETVTGDLVRSQVPTTYQPKRTPVKPGP